MIWKTVLTVLLTIPFALSAAAVKVSATKDHAVLDNGIIRAEFSAKGGKLIRLTAFNNEKNLVHNGKGADTGALKDQFAPKDFTLCTADYNIKAATLSDGTGELTFTTPPMDGEWFFLSLTKKIRLSPGNSRLDVAVTINNKLERMSPYTFTYWSHSYFGVPGEDNYFIYAGKQGIVSKVPTAKENTHGSKPVTDFTRNFVASLGTKSRLGIVLMPEFREMDSVYTWYCKSGSPQDTLEFKLIRDRVQHGSSITKHFKVAVVSGLENLSGAGKTGAGYLKYTPQGLQVYLTGFTKSKETFQYYLNGKRLSAFTATLVPGKVVNVNLGKKPGHYRVYSRNFDMELNCDAKGETLPLKLSIMTKKRPPAAGAGDSKWQCDPSTAYVTPHFKWQNGGKKRNVLFLLPNNGVRDVIELQQRLNINPTVPTVFPNTLPWQTVSEMIQQHHNGLDHLQKYLKRSYDAIVVGANAGIYKIRHGRGSWSSYPADIRKSLLKKCKDGAGLIIIGAGKKDPQLNEIAAQLRKVPASMVNTMTFSAAPFFPKAQIRMGEYGKGRLVVIDYQSDSFIVPHPGYRGGYWRRPLPEHRYQEYQFAIIGKLLMWSSKQKQLFDVIRLKGGALLVRAEETDNGTIEIFDHYSNSYHKQAVKFTPGYNRIKLPALRYGRNFIHVTGSKGDYGYFCQFNKSGNSIKEINLTNTGVKIKGNVTTSTPLKHGESIKVSVVDNLDRLLYTRTSQDGTFEFAPAMILTNRHELRAELLNAEKNIAEKRRDFYLPALRKTTENYTNMLWVCGDNFPLYTYKDRYKQYSEFGFNFLYSGSGNNGMLNMLRYADAECGSNGHGCTAIFYYRKLLYDIKPYTLTHDKKYLVRKLCPNDPKQAKYLASDHVSRNMAEYGTRNVFQLGDEMSMTFHSAAVDICMCQYCMADFRQRMNRKYGSLEKLNAAWGCSFKKWQDVLPYTYHEAVQKDNRAPYLEHRLYMDEVFRRTLNAYRQRLQKKYPGAIVGPTGVNGLPSPYNGNSNFYSMKDFECGSFYKDTRLPVSFNREKRLIMRYRGYSNTKADTLYSFWEGLTLGERSNNSWFGPIFIYPDLRLSSVRKYYSDLLWELRSGMGDLLYHSRKVNDTAAILHSQRSLIINFTKVRKSDFYSKEKDFAQILEDLAIPHRFIAPEELDQLEKFKILILPESSALSDDDVKKIVAFVQRGGTLIADVEPASYDELGRKRKVPALDKLFGVDTRASSLRKIKNTTFKDLPIKFACSGVKAAGTKSLATAKIRFSQSPLWIENRVGKGKTLMLNFVTDYAAVRKRGSAMTFLKRFEDFLNVTPPGKVIAKRPVMHGTFADGEQNYFVMLPEKLWSEMKPAAFDATFRLAKKSHLYDVRQKKYLGFGTQFKVKLTPGDGTVLAALPCKVNKVQLKQTGKNGIRVSVITPPGCPMNGILDLKCFSPDGKEVKHYHQIQKYRNGQGGFHIPFALNERRGTWRIVVTDAASGVSGELKTDLN